MPQISVIFYKNLLTTDYIKGDKNEEKARLEQEDENKKKRIKEEKKEKDEKV